MAAGGDGVALKFELSKPPYTLDRWNGVQIAFSQSCTAPYVPVLSNDNTIENVGGWMASQIRVEQGAPMHRLPSSQIGKASPSVYYLPSQDWLEVSPKEENNAGEYVRCAS